VITSLNDRLRSAKVLNLLTLLLLAIICWVAHFWYLRDFGLYEDDYYFVGLPISTDFDGLIQLVTHKFINFEQGRPLGFSLAYIFAYFSFKIAGLTGVYSCAYLVIITNTLLFYWLMFRLSDSRQLAILGGLAFSLFPADTTATFLTHSLGLYSCITFFLLATHAYLSDRLSLAYLAITASLICYESCFLLFAVVPLLKQKWARSMVVKLLRHGSILGSILVLTIAIRKLVGESRIAELDPLTAIGTSIKHTLLGPFVGVGMYLYRPFYVLANSHWELLIFLLVFGSIFWLISRKLLTNDHRQNHDRSLADLIPRSQLWLVSIVMLFLAYPLTIILKIEEFDGRASRIHLAAIIGGSILIALGCDRLLSIAQNITQKRLVSIGLSVFFTLLVGFGLIVQQDYRLAWTKQQNFWSEVTKLAPDLQAGTAILVERDDLHNPTQIMAYSWSMPVVLDRVYKFPSQWAIVPRTYPIYSNWQQQIDNPDRLPLAKITEWLAFIPQQHPGVVNTQDTIMLKVVNGRLTRLDRLSLKSGITLNFKPRTPQAKINFPHRPLYRDLIDTKAITSSL
jgi:hypothetical protein